MKNKLEDTITEDDKKRLLANFLSLATLQGANYILPLITLPYLVRILGAEYFGLLAFATATIMYFSIITDYGFDLTASREISIHRDNKSKVVEVFCSVMSIKFILMILSFIILNILIFSFDKFSQNAIVYLLSFGLVIGQFLFPVWFFQGMEEMKYITYINLCTRLLFTIAIFVFIKDKNDYYIVPILSSIGSIIGGLYALYHIRYKYDIRFSFQKLVTLKYYFNEAYHIFISNLAISLYTVSTTFILGIFTNNTIVGYFAAGDKIIQAFKGLMGPVSQTIYPYISKKTIESREKGLNLIKKITTITAFFTLSLSIFIYLSAEFLVKILLGPEYNNSIIVVKILSLMPFLIGLSNMFGIQTMLNFGRKRAFSRILIMASIINIILSLLLVPKYNYIGSSISVLIVEAFVTITMLTYLQNNGLKLIGENKNV